MCALLLDETRAGSQELGPHTYVISITCSCRMNGRIASAYQGHALGEIPSPLYSIYTLQCLCIDCCISSGLHCYCRSGLHLRNVGARASMLLTAQVSVLHCLGIHCIITVTIMRFNLCPYQQEMCSLFATKLTWRYAPLIAVKAGGLLL